MTSQYHRHITVRSHGNNLARQFTKEFYSVCIHELTYVHTNESEIFSICGNCG
jgi:hypothetical protein